MVGVIANLGMYSTVHTLFRETTTITTGPLNMQIPQVDTLRWTPLLIGLIAAVLIFKLKWSVLRVLGTVAVLGLIAGVAGLPGI